MTFELVFGDDGRLRGIAGHSRNLEEYHHDMNELRRLATTQSPVPPASHTPRPHGFCAVEELLRGPSSHPLVVNPEAPQEDYYPWCVNCGRELARPPADGTSDYCDECKYGRHGLVD